MFDCVLPTRLSSKRHLHDQREDVWLSLSFEEDFGHWAFITSWLPHSHHHTRAYPPSNWARLNPDTCVMVPHGHPLPSKLMKKVRQAIMDDNLLESPWRFWAPYNHGSNLNKTPRARSRSLRRKMLKALSDSRSKTYHTAWSWCFRQVWSSAFWNSTALVRNEPNCW